MARPMKGKINSTIDSIFPTLYREKKEVRTGRGVSRGRKARILNKVINKAFSWLFGEREPLSQRLWGDRLRNKKLTAKEIKARKEWLAAFPINLRRELMRIGVPEVIANRFISDISPALNQGMPPERMKSVIENARKRLFNELDKKNK